MHAFCLNSSFILFQDLDPIKRPGAGAEGYTSLKNHPFFEGVDWNNIRAQTPPRLALEAGVLFTIKSACHHLFDPCVLVKIRYLAFNYVESFE